MEATNSNPDLTDIEKEIIRQVEYYFSDENLPNDAYMLAHTGGSANKPFNIGRLNSFARMRTYKKPKSLIKDALAKSTKLEFTDSTHIRRRVPLTVEPNVDPRVVAAILTPSTDAVRPGQSLYDPAKPWITKSMYKPTGFEQYYADAPVTPAESAIENDLYSSDIAFETRIETAIQRYMSKRRFHVDMAYVFNAYLAYGGIDCKPRQFTGTGQSANDELQGMEAAEIAAATATHFVAHHVEHSDNWTIDFAAVVQGFMSFDRIIGDINDADSAAAYADVPANFLRYLLHHDVCKEYSAQIHEALAVCQAARTALPAAIRASETLPGLFGRACSVVSGGLFSNFTGINITWDAGLHDDLTHDAAVRTIRTAVAELCPARSDASFDQTRVSKAEITSEKQLILQIVHITMPGPDCSFGKFRCRRLDESQTKPVEDNAEPMTLWEHHETLISLTVGMKLQVTVCANSIGHQWIERVSAVNGEYFKMIPNDLYDKEHDAVLPKEWYKRERTIKEYGYKKRNELAEEDDCANETP